MNLIMEVAETLAEARAAERLLEKRRAKDRQRKRSSVDSAETVEIAETVDVVSPQSPPLKVSPDPFKQSPPLTPHPVLNGARPKFAAPEGVSADQWKAFRQQRKKALTERAYTLLCNKLSELAEAGWPPGEMIDLAIERGWETVFEPKDQVNGRANRGNSERLGRHQSSDGLSSTARAAIAVFGAPAARH